MAKIHSSNAEQIIALATDSLSDTAREGLVLVHFASPLYSGSQRVTEHLRQLPEELDAFVEFREFQLNSEDASMIRRFDIEQLPTMLIFQNGQIVERIEVLMDPEDLENTLRNVVSFYAPI